MRGEIVRIIQDSIEVGKKYNSMFSFNYLSFLRLIITSLCFSLFTNYTNLTNKTTFSSFFKIT